MTSPKTSHHPPQDQYSHQQNLQVPNQRLQEPQQMPQGSIPTSNDQISEAVISQAVSQAISQASQQNQLQIHQTKQNPVQNVQKQQHQQKVWII